MADAVGLAGLESDASDATAWTLFVQQQMAQANHIALVLVTAVTPSGEGKSVGFVSAQPMVHQIDGAGTTQPHGNIPSLAYFRLQGGANAVIIDPVVGDIGVAVFCDRDISVVRKTQAPAQPGSFRRFDWADGVYLGGLLNAIPTQYVEFLPGSDGIKIVSPYKVTIESDLHVTGAIIAGYGGGDQVGLQTHTHSQPPDSHGDTEVETNSATAGT